MLRHRTPLAALLVLAAAFAAAPVPAALPSDDLFTHPQRAAHRFDGFAYSAEERKAEAGQKVTRLRAALRTAGLDGLVLATERNLNWLTAGGKDNVVWAQRETPVKLLVTADRLYLVADNIEGPRMMSEELAGLGYEWARFGWYEGEKATLSRLIRGKRVAFDLPAAAQDYAGSGRKKGAPDVFDLQDVYYPLTPGELKKYRWLGRKTVEVLEQVAGVVRPGMTEHDVQYLLQRELWYWDIFPTVVLSAVDERFQTYRHPVVVGAPLRRYVALNVCTRKWGLVISTTRMVHFGEPEARLARIWKEGAKVNAAMWAASKPGRTLGDVFAAAQRAYAEIGFRDEWRLHHQGGMIGPIERLYLVGPGDKVKIRAGMALAWNPTVQGTKYEDTVVVREDGTLENLTPCLSWPTIPVTVGNTTYQVPGLLVRPMPAP